ncbi:MAG: ABC transporter ATP-binding protein [Candidatus Cohnella colombiensis]|uniref:ABC transporter ATP-binding protein n=1 Tax=Candidatus Cohnella colombiensis TaxID=3121368 RepID=A0AA95ETD4_9BACL|nr:MAG: ABC transporter ATP-binding protein [Cohnella sp.]
MTHPRPDHEASTLYIEVIDARKSFGKVPVLEQITLSVGRGEIFGLLGPSGSGKTTLVNLITGLTAPDQGTVTLLGERMPQLKLLSKIGYMAQSDALYGELSAYDNLTFFASLYGLHGAALKHRIVEVAELVQLSEHLNRPVNQYSGGMKRRLSLAVSIMHKPEVLVLDEPTVGIDPVLRKTVWAELNRFRREGTAILVTTHVMDEAEKCDRLAMLRDGRIIAIGSPEQLKLQSQSESMEDAFIAFGGGVR